METLATRATQNKFGGRGIKNEYMSNKVLAEELHKPIIRKFKKRKVRLFFIEKVWVADLAHMQLISNLIKELFFWCMLLIFLENRHGLLL